MKVVFLSLLGLWPALSGTISVSSTGFTVTATATLASPGTYAYDSQSYSQTYVLLVTGGTGQGMAYPGVALRGETNESNSAWNILGSWARFGGITAGDPYGRAGPGIPPDLYCGTHTYPSCGIPFTFDTPETIHVGASVEAMIQPGPYAPATFFMTAGGSVTFAFDSFIVTDRLGQPVSGDPIVILAPVADSSVPEPGSWSMMLAAGLVILLVRHRRGYLVRWLKVTFVSSSSTSGLTKRNELPALQRQPPFLNGAHSLKVQSQRQLYLPVGPGTDLVRNR